MSTVTDAIETQNQNQQVRAEGTEILQLDPTMLQMDEHTDVRPWESTTTAEDEKERIDRLARTIEQEGQLQPIVAREIIDADTGEVRYSIIAGRRRTAAIKLINDRHEKEGSPLRLPVNVSILRGVSDDAAFRKAMMENAQRLQMSPMDMALNINAIRTRLGWENDKGWTKKVAEFLGVSRAFVSQKVKLFDLPDAMQADIHAGRLSEEAAWVAVKVKPEHRAEVMAKAQEKAADEAASGKATGETSEESAQGAEGGEATGETANDPAATTSATGEPKVTQSHVLAAAREKEGSTEKPLGPLNRKELIQSFEQFDSNVYGEKNGAVRKFIVYFVDTYAKGAGTPTMFKRLFNKMVEGADKGTPEPVKEEKAEKGKAEKGEKGAGKVSKAKA